MELNKIVCVYMQLCAFYLKYVLLFYFELKVCAFFFIVLAFPPSPSHQG